MKQLLLVCTVFFMVTGCKENKTKKQNIASEWISLFDGSTLDGWRAYNGESLPQGWAIVDSVMTFTSVMVSEEEYDYKKSRDIIYGAQEFENFELYVEWKIPPGGNSGIFYHIKEGYGGPPQISPEYQLIDDIEGVGFIKADEIANKLGIPKDDMRRIKAAIIYAMQYIAYQNGDLY